MSSTTGQLRNRRHVSQVEGKAALARKSSTKITFFFKRTRYTSTSGTHSHNRHHHDYHPHDSKQHNCWVELVRVCRLAVVAAAAACCSYCDKENPPPPNEARAIRREGRRAISAQLAGRVVRTCQSCIFWPRGWGLSMSNYPTCSNESS